MGGREGEGEGGALYLEQGFDEQHQHPQGGDSRHHVTHVLHGSGAIDSPQGDICRQTHPCRTGPH